MRGITHTFLQSFIQGPRQDATRLTSVEIRRAESERAIARGKPGQKAHASSVVETEQRRVIIVGAPADAPRALQHPEAVAGRLNVVGVLAVDVEADECDEWASTLTKLVRTHDAKAILLAGPVGVSTMRRVADVALLHQCELLAVMPTDVLAEHDPIVVWSGDSPLVRLARTPARRWALSAKRAIDVAGAALGLLVTAPLLALLALAIRVESKGMPLFLHERIGYRGRRFRCLKLRTMRVDAEERLRNDPKMYDEYRRNHFKIPDDRDPRVTALGRLLRRASLDELPQLWNVLTGDMSLVGPRPMISEELDLYNGARDLVLSVRPGITGNWAVGGRHGVGYPERCNLELRYVRDWSLVGDVRILAKTLQAVLRPNGNRLVADD
jgi:lipopolysaccharide/colanic/teichoic acid biosynthesis glycosyltransferase